MPILEGMKTYQMTTKGLASSYTEIHKRPYGYSVNGFFGAGGWKQQPEVLAHIDGFVDKVVKSSADE